MEKRRTIDPWFALQVRTRHESLVVSHLTARGYEPFLPMYVCRRRWSDRVKEVSLPLFPGYVFCRLDVSNRLPILTAPGVASILGIAKNPTPLDETEISAIRAATVSGLPREPWPFLKVGQAVKIEQGPLAGIEGILTDFKGQHRLILSVTLLQRSVAVEVEDAWVALLADKAEAAASEFRNRMLMSTVA
jgi:transcription antitermination factor NusG